MKMFWEQILQGACNDPRESHPPSPVLEDFVAKSLSQKLEGYMQFSGKAFYI